MHITANGKQLDIAQGSNLQALLDQLGMNASRVAVEHNRAIVPRANFATTPLAPGDRVEIVQFVGGG
jgi:thiamine biosynthesis protein ThiS